MASIDPEKISDNLTKIQKQIIDLSDNIWDLASTLSASSGKLKSVIAPNLENLSNSVYQLQTSKKTYSVNMIKEYLDAIPVGDLKDENRAKHSEVMQKLEQEEEESKETFDSSDLVPDTSQGQRSQIQQKESTKPLEAFFGQQGMFKKSSTFHENSVIGRQVSTLQQNGYGGNIDFNVSKMIEKAVESPKSIQSNINRLKEQQMDPWGDDSDIQMQFREDSTPAVQKQLRQVIDQRNPLTEMQDLSDKKLEESFNWQSFSQPGQSIGMPDLTFDDLQNTLS